MATDDIRISRWNLMASAGTTQVLTFTATETLASLSVYTGGTVSDVDDLTDATEHAGVLSTTTVADDTATVSLAVPAATSPTPLRLVVDGTVQTVGLLHPSQQGTASPDASISLTPGEVSISLTILGSAVAWPSDGYGY